MLGKLGLWRHFIVAASIAVCVVLAALGFLGGRGESFDAKQITVAPTGGDGVRIREVVDQDFGNVRRHGYERIIPTTFGFAEEISASSPDANADVGVDEVDGDVVNGVVQRDARIRLGDRDVTWTGQHRYILSYTLPDAEVSSGTLNLAIINPGEELETGRFEVILTGFQFSSTSCLVGSAKSPRTCTLEPAGNDYHVVFEPLAAGDGVTVGGTISGLTTPVEPELPPLPPRAEDNRMKVAAAMVPLGLLGGGLVFVLARRRGRNEVFAGGAAEAAYGRLPGPSADGRSAPSATRLVPDDHMDELATIEFVPPKGIDPWQGAVLLRERIDDTTVSAWFSGLVASEAITLRDDDGTLVVGVGPRAGQLDPSTATIVAQFFSGRSELRLGSYDASFAAAWGSVLQRQKQMIASSGWWKKRPPGGGGAGALAVVGRLIFVVVVLGFTVGASLLSTAAGLLNSIWVALAVGLLVPALVAAAVYATLLPARSATGSALTLLTESFRRFLDASEGRHVDWAWKQGLLREYSAWAVALGEADAWGKALNSSNVPPPTLGTTNPLLVYSMSRSFSSSHTAPSSSSGGGGGGSIGGGGGGGSSGSW